MPLSSPLPLASTSTTAQSSVQPVSVINPAFFLATLFLLPMTILLLKLLYDSWHTAGKAEDNNCRQTPDPATFNKDMVAADDALAKVAGYILAYGNEEDQLLLEDFTSTAKQLRLEQTGKRYDQSALDTLILELDDFIQEHHLGNPCTQTP